MLKNRLVIPTLAAVTLTIAGSAAMAGTAPAAALTADQVAKIEKDCKVAHKDDTAAYNTCVSDQKKAAEAK